LTGNGGLNEGLTRGVGFNNSIEMTPKI